jgi:DNA-binding beta-propeller fold protein YncE
LFDALSNSGQSLYLIQKMSDARHYQVRLYDLGAGWLLPQPVADKREPNEPMNGIRGDSAADPTGNHVYTVYVRDGGPFIHALSLDQPFAFCVDLPKDAVNNLEQQFHWSLAITPDGSTIYAVNGSLGKVSLIRTAGTPTVVRTAPVALNRSGDLLASLFTNAEAKGPQLGGAALSADSRTLFTFGETGVVAIDTATLKVRAHFLDPWRPDAMRLSSDGKWLYVAEPGESKLWQIDPVTGAVAEINGVAQPWALLWAQPK